MLRLLLLNEQLKYSLELNEQWCWYLNLLSNYS